MISLKNYCWLCCLLLAGFSCREKTGQPIHHDVAFVQDYSKKYTFSLKDVQLQKVRSDRNGVIQVLSSQGLLKPDGGQFLYPGVLVKDLTYRPLTDKKITDLDCYQNQFIYLDNEAILANAWAGSIYLKHFITKAKLVKGGTNFSFLVSDGKLLHYIADQEVRWKGEAPDSIIDILHHPSQEEFWLLTPHSLFVFSVKKQMLAKALQGNDFTSFDLHQKEIIIGTKNGYLNFDPITQKMKGEVNRKIPSTAVTIVKEINQTLWIGTTQGAFSVSAQGKFNYYASQRWLPSDTVIDIASGPDSSVLVLTKNGLGQICFSKMTLHDKAMYYEQQVRERHIRNGFNATLARMTNGNLATGTLEDSDNDGLWTSMYLGSQVFRYKVTHSTEALENIRESMDAMERLHTINPVKGFPSRSFERKGYALHDLDRWINAADPEWVWKSTTSSDEAIGHIFSLSVVAELLDDQKDVQARAITLIDSLMNHTITNHHYLVDWDGKPTLWGRWNPEYVNARPVEVGDRKINSSNYIAMLQTAYHFTKKEIYKETALELLTKHGYYNNLMRPMKKIGKAPDDADDWSKMLSPAWNHSDDEMYFLGYWGLYRYALNDTLKANYKQAILDHWEMERPEKDGLWNITAALTGTPQFDLPEAIWYLQEYPLDLVEWKTLNSKRQDIVFIDSNFRNQTTKEVLPPDELPINRHNANRFDLDGGDDTSEYSAGDIWLLPYWMGRYLGVISAPTKTR